jgi:histidyl-tRNA synthetase
MEKSEEQKQVAQAPQEQKQANPDNKAKKKDKGENTNESKRGRNAKKGVIETEPVIGTRDFLPADMRMRNMLFDKFREAARRFAFQEYDAPILELEELYKRKAGEEITQQMYNFEDKDKYLVTLRPEMTPTLARLILKTGRNLLLPIRWFSIPQCWRYENTTRGRKREHYQWNMDIVGVKEVTAEVELLAAITTLFKSLGLTSKDVGIKINSRKVLQNVLEPLGVTKEKFAPVCVIVDKLDKLEAEAVQKMLAELGLSEDVIAKINTTLTIKDLGQLEEVLGKDSPVMVEFRDLWTYAKAYGFDDWLQFDASVVRGLAYYTGIVFEAFAKPPVQLRAICGGGRYDGLLTLYGSKTEIPAAGFGFGDCVIVELLKEKGLYNDIPPEIDDIVIAYDETMRVNAYQVANKLRDQGRAVEVQLIPGKKIPWCFNYADRIGAKRAVLIAPDEWGKGLVRVKELRTAKAEEDKGQDVPLDQL